MWRRPPRPTARNTRAATLTPPGPGTCWLRWQRAPAPAVCFEIGGGLGYSALWLAHGSAPHGTVESIEADSDHAAVIRDFASKYGYAERIKVLLGRDEEVLPTLQGPYDLVFYDAYIPGRGLVDQVERLVAPGGALLASNIFLGRYVPDNPDLPRGAAFRQRLLDSSGWLVSFVNGKLLAVRRR